MPPRDAPTRYTMRERESGVHTAHQATSLASDSKGLEATYCPRSSSTAPLPHSLCPTCAWPACRHAVPTPPTAEQSQFRAHPHANPAPTRGKPPPPGPASLDLVVATLLICARLPIAHSPTSLTLNTRPTVLTNRHGDYPIPQNNKDANRPACCPASPRLSSPRLASLHTQNEQAPPILCSYIHSPSLF